MFNPEAAEVGSPFAFSLGSGYGAVPETIWSSSHARSIWQRLTVFFLAVVSAVCLHYFMYHLHAILMPFFLSAFIVFALQPSVDFVYRVLAGLTPPHRWCLCCLSRGDARALSRTRSQQVQEERLYGSCCWGGNNGRVPDAEGQAGRREPELIEVVPTMAIMALEACCRFVAVTLAMLFMVLVASMFLVLLAHGAIHMKENWAAYRAGFRRLQKMQDTLIDTISHELHMEDELDIRLKEAYDRLLDQAQGMVWAMVNGIVSGVSEGVSQLVIVMLYVMFWLMQPLPTAGKASTVVRSYLFKKSFVSFLYGGCVALLFTLLQIDLAIFFGVVSFFLNFVPEVGAFISMIVPVPVILLDGRLKNPLLVLATATLGQLVLKFFIGNILEVKLIERDKEMNIHPVWIILGLSYFGFVWGPMGALLSVPLMAMAKTAALHVRGEQPDAEAVVPAMAETFLACFEGRNTCWARPSCAKPPDSYASEEQRPEPVERGRPPVQQLPLGQLPLTPPSGTSPLRAGQTSSRAPSFAAGPASYRAGPPHPQDDPPATA